MRNIQLSSCSLLIGLGLVVLNGDEVVRRGFFSGYSPMVWLCISLNSLGGLAVAMVVKYADNLVSARLGELRPSQITNYHWRDDVPCG